MKEKKTVDAYMTVEISILFPLIVIILMCVFYVTFFSYNRTIAFQNASVVSLYGKYGFLLEESDKTEEMYRVLKILNEGQYIAINQLKQIAAVEQGKIIIKQEGNVNIPLFHLEMMSRMNFFECVELSEYNPVFIIRQIKKVQNSET